MLQDGGEHVPESDLVLAGALHVQHGRLQHPLKRDRLVRLPAACAAGKLLERAEKLVERMAECRQVGATGGENLLALRVVRQGVEQVFEREVRMSSCRRLAVGDVQDQLERGTEHELSVTPLRASPAAESRPAWPDPGRSPPWSRPPRSCRRRTRRGPACAPAS